MSKAHQTTPTDAKLINLESRLEALELTMLHARNLWQSLDRMPLNARADHVLSQIFGKEGQ